MRERKREEREDPTSLYDLRRSGGRNSSGQERKFIYSTRVTRGYKKRGALEKSIFLGLGGALETSFNFSTLKEIGILPTFIYFPL